MVNDAFEVTRGNDDGKLADFPEISFSNHFSASHKDKIQIQF